MLMFWLIFPIFDATFYALGRFLENHLIDKALPKKSAEAYIGMQAFSFAFAILILVAVFGRAVVMLPLPVALGLCGAGVLNVVGSIIYMRALRLGDTVEVTIFEESSPLIALALGALILGETITVNQALAFVLIMAAATVLVVGNKARKAEKLKLKTAAVSFLSAFVWVLSDVLFVWVLGDRISDVTLFGQSFFYFELGSLLATVLCLVFSSSWRKALRRGFFGRKKAKELFAAMVDNVLYTAAEFFYKLGLLAAPAVALVSVVAQVGQLAIVVPLGIFLAKVFPKFSYELHSKRLIVQHLVAAVLVATGIILIG